MTDFSKIESSYISKYGCRLIWKGVDEDDQDIVVLGKDELEQLYEILSKDSTGKVELEDEFSRILINTDTTQFTLREHKTLEVSTLLRKKSILEFKKIPYQPNPIKIYPKEFFPSIQIEKDSESANELLNQILSGNTKVVPTDLFRVMATRRSTRNFDTIRIVEEWKVEKFLQQQILHQLREIFRDLRFFTLKTRN